MTRLRRHPTATDFAADVEPADTVSSRLVGVAIGIAMTTYKMVYDQAYATLQRASRRQRRRLEDVAEEVVVQANTTMRDGSVTASRKLKTRLNQTLSK